MYSNLFVYCISSDERDLKSALLKQRCSAEMCVYEKYKWRVAYSTVSHSKALHN